MIAVRPLGRMPKSNQRWIFQVLGTARHLVVIVFAISDIQIFEGCEDGCVRNWTPLHKVRHAWDAESAMYQCGMEAV